VPDWRIGLSTGCCWNTSIFECLADIRAHDFELIEICSHPAHLDYHDAPLVRRAATAVRSLGLKAHSFHAPFSNLIDITSPELSTRLASTQELIKAAEAAAMLEAEYFVVHPGPEKAGFLENERIPRLQNALDVLNQLIERCRVLGLEMILENMLPHLFTGRAENLTWLLHAFADPDIGLCLDTGHAHLARNLPQLVQDFASRLRLVHASDNHGSWDEHLPPGAGNIKWAPIVERLSKFRYEGALIVEVANFGTRESTIERACWGREYLRGRIRSLEAPIAGEELRV
jgi:sugar phosphate isomerase/epimerase